MVFLAFRNKRVEEKGDEGRKEEKKKKRRPRVRDP
jgi:hypothetical protein